MIFGIGRRPEPVEPASGEKNPAEFEAPRTGETVKDIGRKPNWKDAFTAAGIALSMNAGGVEADSLKGKELLQARETNTALAQWTVAGLLPENRKSIQQEDGTERVIVNGTVSPDMSLYDLSRKMSEERDSVKAEATLKSTAQRIKEIISDKEVESKLLVMLATESREGATAILQAQNNKEYSSNVFGDLATAGDLIEMVKAAGMEEYQTAYEDGNDAKEAQKVLTAIKFAVGVYIANGDPTKAPILLSEALAQK